jgi:hypothetical protein
MFTNACTLQSAADPGQWGPCLLHLPLLKWWAPLCLTPLLLLGLGYWPSLSRSLRRAHGILVVASLVGFGGLCLARARSNIVEPPEWDMLAFWTFGRVAASGQNFYLPAAFHAIAQALAGQHPALLGDPLFVGDVLDVGFPYPPPAMLLIAPLGYLDLRSASLAWHSLHLVALGTAILLLWQTFLRGEGWRGLAVVAALVLSLRPTYATVAFGQINFLVLIVLLLFWRSQAEPVGGLYLAIAVMAKPVLAVLVAALVLRGCWRTLGVALLTVGALCAATIALFGSGSFLTYFTANPVARLPDWIYRIDENQSLLAAILRATDATGTGGSPLTHPLYLLSAALLGGAALWLAWRNGRSHPRVVLALMLPTALLLYPQSWEHYTLFLIVPILLCWTERHALRLGVPFLIAFVSAVYALVRYEEGTVALFGSLLTWCVLAGIMLVAPAAGAAQHAPDGAV